MRIWPEFAPVRGYIGGFAIILDSLFHIYISCSHWIQVDTAPCCSFALSHTCMILFIKVSTPYFPASIFIHCHADSGPTPLKEWRDLGCAHSFTSESKRSDGFSFSIL